MHADAPPPIPVDPNLSAEQEQAQKNLTTALQGEAAADTANLMTRYGTRLALASSGINAVPPPQIGKVA